MTIAAGAYRLRIAAITGMQPRIHASNRNRVSARPKDRNGRIGPRIRSLLAQCRPGWSLPREFYFDEEIYRLDLERVWRQGWLFAGHSCEMPAAGDYLTLRVDADSIIVTRCQDGVVRAFHNVCRHRGSIICGDDHGHTSRFVCPYHQWTYGTDGKLLACRGMPEDFDKAQFSLHSVHAREVEGLIYISLASKPSDFGVAQGLLGSAFKPQGMSRARVAKTVDYEIQANWKLVWENNRECYHCNANHPQYIKANFDHYNADDRTERVRKRIDAQVTRSEAKWAASGLAVSHKQTGMTRFPDAERNIWFSANRTALVEGWVSETMDGRQAAPLMGDYRDADVGTLRARTLPNFWNHSSCDHGVSTRLLPGGAQLTLARVTWLVHEGAVEGRDYKLDDLLPFWQLTSEQDWEICKRQQRGVNSSAYTPGPYSPTKEYNVDSFVRWYLKMIS
jgi:Rieske 2Fe-2S family protein